MGTSCFAFMGLILAPFSIKYSACIDSILGWLIIFVGETVSVHRKEVLKRVGFSYIQVVAEIEKSRIYNLCMLEGFKSSL